MGWVPDWARMQQPELSVDSGVAVPILELIESKTGVTPETDGIVDIAIQKHRCMSSWCPVCFRLYVAPQISAKMQSMNWASVRIITLTIDREQFADGEAAYQKVKDSQAISAMCRNFVRFAGKEIKNWLWVLEWHEDGFPHWHLVVEMRQSGRRSMIGQEIIHKYWPWGRIREGYVSDARHWRNISGYLQKKGYLTGGDDKGHQTELPEWAKNYGHRIKRRGSMRIMKSSGFSMEGKNVIKIGEKFHVINDCERSYKIKLEACGQSTKVKIISSKYRFPEIELSIPYAQILKEVGELQYCKGLGFCKRVDWIGLWAFLTMYADFMQEGCFAIFDSSLNGDLKIAEGR